MTIFLGPRPLSKEPSLQGVIFANFSCGITVKSIQKHFGYTHDAKWLTEFISSFERFGMTDEALVGELNAPQTDPTGSQAETYSPDTVYRTAAFISRANDQGLLSVLELKYYKAASRILAFANADALKNDLEDSCGLLRYKTREVERFSAYFSKVATDEACLWIRNIPTHFWAEILRIGKWEWSDLSQNPHYVAPLFYELFFNRISGELHDKLRQQPPKRRYGKLQKIGDKDLESQLTIWLALLRAASNPEKLNLLLNEIVPSRGIAPPKFTPLKHPNQGNFAKSLKSLLEKKRRV